MLNYLLGDYVTDGGHNIINTPYFVEYPYYGYLIIAVDDSDYKYAEELADLVASYGSKITWFVNHRTTYEHGHEPLEEGITEREAAIARLASDGHDIGCHMVTQQIGRLQGDADKI